MADYIETKEQRLFGLVPIWKTTKSKTTIHVDSEQKATNENESELNIITGTKGDRYTKQPPISTTKLSGPKEIVILRRSFNVSQTKVAQISGRAPNMVMVCQRIPTVSTML